MSSQPICASCKKSISPTAKFCDSCGQAVVAPKLMFGDYEATEIIGEGGMGRVYKAIQRRLNRAVCIKTLLPQFASDAETSKRFAKEATTTAALSHPNIVSIFDVGETPEGVAYMVMELIDGRPLRAVLRDEAPLQAGRAVQLMDQVLSALAEAHTHGVVHRDLKPANVLVVAQRDGAELCKLLDFGIARVTKETDERLTRTGMMVGTPGYMAPEQIVGDEVDHRADLYAAGAIFYELLSGARVFTAENDLDRFKKVLMEDPPAPSSRTKAAVPAALDAVCLKALRRSAAERYQSAGEFRDALAQALRSQTASSGSNAFGGQIDRSPIATLVSPDGTSDTNSRALLAAALTASDEWERSRLIDPLERVLREALAAGDIKVLRTTVSALQEELKAKGPSENLKTLFNVVRDLLNEQLSVLLDWLGDEKQRPAAKWLLQLLGRNALDSYLKLLPGLRPEIQRHLMEVVRAIDPDASLMANQVRNLEPGSIKALLIAARGWPADQSFAVFNAALQSGDAGARLAALESLDEANAFRFGVVVRQRLHDSASPVRVEAMRWVFRLEDEAAVPDLAKLLERTTVQLPERRSAWRTLSRLKSDGAIDLLALILNATTEPDQVAELAVLLVRTAEPHAMEVVRAQLAGSKQHPKRRAALEAALRGS